MIEVTTPQISGELSLTIVDDKGGISHETTKNLVLNSAQGIISSALAGEDGAGLAIVAVGTNSNPASLTDTTIANSSLIDIRHVEYPAPGHVLFHFTIGNDDADGKSIWEFGLLTARYHMFSRLVRTSPIEKNSSISIDGQWLIKIQ